MIIRPAQRSDLDKLRELSIAAFVKAYAAFNTETDMQHYVCDHFSEAVLSKELANERLHYLVAMEKEEVAGYAKLDRSPEMNVKAKHPLEIARLYAHPDKMNSGIGVRLMQAIDEFARTNGHDALCLGVWQKNFRAINFYQREGFRICGLTQFRLGQDLQDDFVMMRAVK